MSAPPQGQIPTFKLILVGDGGTGTRRSRGDAPRRRRRRRRRRSTHSFERSGAAARGNLARDDGWMVAWMRGARDVRDGHEGGDARGEMVRA